MSRECDAPSRAEVIRVERVGRRVEGYRPASLGFRVKRLGCRVEGYRPASLGFRVKRLGCRVEGYRPARVGECDAPTSTEAFDEIG
jgi:hypothetical protein